MHREINPGNGNKDSNGMIGMNGVGGGSNGGSVGACNLLVVGIGGVGGYVGGMLSRLGESEPALKVHMMARGEHLDVIRREGLTVVHGDRSFTTRPASASDGAGDLGCMDVILVCTKSYDLPAALEALRPCLKPRTLLLPLLNGVSAAESIRRRLPNHDILDGCVYMVSRLSAPGLITLSGARQRIDFGLEGEPVERHEGARRLRDWFVRAGLDAAYHERIHAVMWKKYLFISVTATATSFFDAPVGVIASDPEKMSVWRDLLDEALSVARAEGVELSGGIAEEITRMLEGVPPESTTSLHSDRSMGRQATELDIFTLDMIRRGERHGLHLPVYARLHGALEGSVRTV